MELFHATRMESGEGDYLHSALPGSADGLTCTCTQTDKMVLSPLPVAHICAMDRIREGFAKSTEIYEKVIRNA